MLLRWTELRVHFHNLNAFLKLKIYLRPRKSKLHNFTAHKQLWRAHSQYKWKRAIEKNLWQSKRREKKLIALPLHPLNFDLETLQIFKMLNIWTDLFFVRDPWSQVPIHFQGVDAVCFIMIPELRDHSIWERKQEENLRVLNALSLHANPAQKNKW